MPAGRYKIELPENETSVSLAKDFYIDVQEKPNYPILDGSDLAYLKYTKVSQVKIHKRDFGIKKALKFV